MLEYCGRSRWWRGRVLTSSYLNPEIAVDGPGRLFPSSINEDGTGRHIVVDRLRLSPPDRRHGRFVDVVECLRPYPPDLNPEKNVAGAAGWGWAKPEGISIFLRFEDVRVILGHRTKLLAFPFLPAS